jgi:hypothetical protein
MLLGLMLAYGPISSTASLDPALLTNYTNHALDRFPTFLPLLVPAAIFVIPYADLMFAIIRRTRAGKPLMAADRQHLHHRVLNIGHSYRQSVLIMYLWAALFSVTVVSLSVVRTRLVVFVIATAVAVLALLPVTMPSLRPWRLLRRGAAIPAVARAGAAAAAARPGIVSAAHRRTARTTHRGTTHRGTTQRGTTQRGTTQRGTTQRGTTPAARPGPAPAAPRGFAPAPLAETTPVAEASGPYDAPSFPAAPYPMAAAGPYPAALTVPFQGDHLPRAGRLPGADPVNPFAAAYPAHPLGPGPAESPAVAESPGPAESQGPVMSPGPAESPGPFGQPQPRDARPW